MAHVKHRARATRTSAATKGRNFRTFLLVTQLKAKEIGDRIAEARKELGLTQEQVTDLATFSKRSLQDYETGVTIPYRQMPELARLLKRDVAWLLHGEQAPAPMPNGLLGEIATNVSDLTDSMAAALVRLERIEAALGKGEAQGTGT